MNDERDEHEDEQEAQARRNETVAERSDRKWAEMLQELRVMQTGAQLIAGFLLTLPFQSTFDGLDEFQRDFFLVLVVLAGLTTAIVMTPVAIHRALSGRHVKHRLVRAGAILIAAAMTMVSLLVIGITTFIFDMVISRTWAFAVGGAMTVVLVALLAVLPWRLVATRG